MVSRLIIIKDSSRRFRQGFRIICSKTYFPAFFKKTIAGSFIQENWSQYPVVEGHRPYQQQDRADPSNLNQVAAGIIGGIYYYTNANIDREGDM